MSTAPYFKRVTNLDGLRVLPPYEPSDKAAQWVRGYLRTSEGGDFTVTGPRMRLCFSGCRWNKMVFAMVGLADPETYAFEQWLKRLSQVVENAIWQQPERFKPGAKSSSRFMFEHDLIRPSSDPAAYPDQFSCRLSGHRQQLLDDPTSFMDVMDADLFRDEDGQIIKMDPSEITAGSYVVPIIRFSYFRNIERFGITATILRAQVFPGETRDKISNEQWQFDSDEMVV